MNNKFLSPLLCNLLRMLIKRERAVSDSSYGISKMKLFDKREISLF